MTPIISPWIFYAMQLCDTVGMFFGIAAVVAGIVLFWQALENLNFNKKFKYTKLLVVTIVVCTLISMLCPTQSTLTKMIVAQNVTYERVEIASETVQDVYEDIISLVDGNEDAKEE